MYSESMIQSYQWFFVNSYWIIITICSFAIIFWYSRKDIRLCKLIIIGIICFFCGVNSFTKNLVIKIYPDGYSTFYRLFWILPIVLLSTYAIVLVIKSIEKKIIKVLFCFVFLIGMIVISPIKEFIQNGNLPENVYFVSDEIREMNIIMKDNTSKSDEYYFADAFIYWGLQAYSKHLVFPFDRYSLLNYNEWLSWDNERYDWLFRTVLNGEKADKEEREQIKKILDEKNITYIVINRNMFLSNYYEKLGYHYLGETENYIVYEKDQV